VNQTINNDTPKWLDHHFGLTKDQVSDAAKKTGMSEEEIRTSQDSRVKSARGLLQHGAQIDEDPDKGTFHLTDKQKGAKEDVYFRDKKAWEAGDKLHEELGLNADKNQSNDRPPETSFGQSPKSGANAQEQQKDDDDEELRKAADELGIDLTKGLKKKSSTESTQEVVVTEEQEVGIESSGLPENFLELPKDEQEKHLAQYGNGAVSIKPDSNVKKGNGNGNGNGAVAHSSSPPSKERDAARIKGFRKAKPEDVAEQKRNLMTALGNPMRLGKDESKLDALEKIVDRRAKGSGAKGLGGKEVAVKQALEEIRQAKPAKSLGKREKDEVEAEHQTGQEKKRHSGIQKDAISDEVLNAVEEQNRFLAKAVDEHDGKIGRGQLMSLARRLKDEGVDFSDKSDIRVKAFEIVAGAYSDGIFRQDIKTHLIGKLRSDRRSVEEKIATLEKAAEEEISRGGLDKKEKTLVGEALTESIDVLKTGPKAMEKPEKDRSDYVSKKDEVTLPEPEVTAEGGEAVEREPNLNVIINNLTLLQQSRQSIGNSSHNQVNQSLKVLGDRGLDQNSVAKVRKTIDAIKKGYVGPYWREKVDAIEAEVSLAEKQLEAKKSRVQAVKERKGSGSKEQKKAQEQQKAKEQTGPREYTEKTEERIRENLKHIQSQIEEARTLLKKL